jgi:hypothetical protein
MLPMNQPIIAYFSLEIGLSFANQVAISVLISSIFYGG